MTSFVHKKRLICVIDDYIYSIGLSNWIIDVRNIEKGVKAFIDADILGLKEEWPRITRELKDERYV